MMDMIQIGNEVQVKRPHAKRSQSLESTGALQGISCLKGEVTHSVVDGDRREKLVWSQITKGLEYQCADFIYSQRESIKEVFFFFFFFLLGFLKFRCCFGFLNGEIMEKLNYYLFLKVNL